MTPMPEARGALVDWPDPPAPPLVVGEDGSVLSYGQLAEWWRFLPGAWLELGGMTGAVIELADRLGVGVPHVRTVHACTALLDTVNRGSGAHAAQ